MRAYVCPFCDLAYSQNGETTRTARHAFELHVDVHLARGDELQAAS